MMKCIVTAFLIIFINQIFAADIGSNSTVNIEHQIRICDSEANILNAIKKYQPTKKNMEVYYLETSDFQLSKNYFSIRLRLKESKIEVTVKKRMNSNVDITDVKNNSVCEYDLHGGIRELSCKIDYDTTIQNFNDFKLGKIRFQKLLNQSQLDFIKDIELPEEINLLGTLKSSRYAFNNLTLDIVSVIGHEDITYHEISKRYPKDEENSSGVAFENYVKSLNLHLCKNQLDWNVSKFQILEIKN